MASIDDISVSRSSAFIVVLESKQLRPMSGGYGINCTSRYTCGGRFGSLGFEEIDAKTYAEWGVDYLSKDLSATTSTFTHLV